MFMANVQMPDKKGDLMVLGTWLLGVHQDRFLVGWIMLMGVA